MGKMGAYEPFGFEKKVNESASFDSQLLRKSGSFVYFDAQHCLDALTQIVLMRQRRSRQIAR